MAARVIGCLTQKGGGGKTTTATHLAVWLSMYYPKQKLAVFDLDEAEHFTTWQKQYEKASGQQRPWQRFTMSDSSAAANIKHLSGFDIVLIDGAPGMNDTMQACIEVCDSIIIPTNPSAGGINSARATATALRFHPQRKEHLKAALCMNRMVRTNTAKDFYDAMHNMNFPALTNTTTFLDVWERAAFTGYTVFELEPNGKAAEETDQVFTELMEKLQ